MLSVAHLYRRGIRFHKKFSRFSELKLLGIFQGNVDSLLEVANSSPEIFVGVFLLIFLREQVVREIKCCHDCHAVCTHHFAAVPDLLYTCIQKVCRCL